MNPTIERRFVAATELRVEGDSAPTIDGYAALFNSESQDLGGFREVIAPGAFAGVLKTADVRALFNHDANHVLGRTAAGTLTLEEDSKGLRSRITPPDTQFARDLLVSIRRGDVSGMSFGFKVAPGGQRFDRRNGTVYRTITNFGLLLDVSPVTYPAYVDTSVAVRSMQDWAAESPEDKELADIVTHSRAIAERRLKLVLALG